MSMLMRGGTKIMADKKTVDLCCPVSSVRVKSDMMIPSRLFFSSLSTKPLKIEVQFHA